MTCVAVMKANGRTGMSRLTGLASNASAASAAVSARSTRGPSVSGAKPRAMRVLLLGGAQAAFGAAQHACVARRGAGAARGSRACRACRSARLRTKRSASPIGGVCDPAGQRRAPGGSRGTRLRPHCSQAAMAIPSQCARFLSARSPARRSTPCAVIRAGCSPRRVRWPSRPASPCARWPACRPPGARRAAPRARRRSCAPTCTVDFAAAHALDRGGVFAAVAVEQRQRVARLHAQHLHVARGAGRQRQRAARRPGRDRRNGSAAVTPARRRSRSRPACLRPRRSRAAAA